MFYSVVSKLFFYTQMPGSLLMNSKLMFISSKYPAWNVTLSNAKKEKEKKAPNQTKPTPPTKQQHNKDTNQTNQSTKKQTNKQT